MRTSLNGIALTGLLLVGTTPTWADNIPACPEPSGVQIRSFPDQIPEPLMKALTDNYGLFARPGEQFNSTDAHIPGEPIRSNRRVIFVWEQEARWIVATEHGGRGYNDPILVYDLDVQSSKATLVKEEVAFPPTVCNTAKKWVARKP
jgi:hypothetical protein